MDIDKNSGGIVTAKVCGMVVFGLVPVIIGLVPIFVHSHLTRKKSCTGSLSTDVQSNGFACKNLILHLSAFGGGVLLSTTFLHLLPEIRESIGSLQREKVVAYSKSVPSAELLMCLGFLFLYLIEELAHKVSDAIRCHRSDKRNGPVRDSSRIVNDGSNVGDPSDVSVDVNLSEPGNRATQINSDDRPSLDGKYARELSVEINNKGFLSDASLQCQGVIRNDDSEIFFTEGSGKSFLLIFALSIHEGFEGLAIGLESRREAVWYMILGVGAHKAVIAFCIGVQMLSTKLDRKVAVVYVIVFATATPLGVAVGLFLYTGSGIFTIILQGVATGTLLHVVFFELLKPHSKHSPFVGVFVGFIIMAVLKYYSP